MKFVAIFVVGVMLVVGGSWLLGQNKQKESKQEIAGIVTYTITDRTHVETEVTYEQTPPVGGAHNSVWSTCNGNVYDEPIDNEKAVHSLEHGAVWITYRSDVPSEQVEILKKKMTGYTLMSPYPEQASPIVLTAWNVQLALENANDERVDAFLKKYRQGKQTPEPGATCAASTEAVDMHQ